MTPMADTGTGPVRRTLNFLRIELRKALVPVAFFFCAFNIIVSTTHLMIHDYWFALGDFLVATTMALIVGKAILLANALPLIERFRYAPLIQPILFKTLVYSLVTMAFRVLERFVHIALDADGFGAGFADALASFSWRRFVAVQIWLVVTFLAYVTFSELNDLLGDGQLGKLLFRYRRRELQLSRRQHVRALVELSRMAQQALPEQLLDPTSPTATRALALLRSLASRRPEAAG